MSSAFYPGAGIDMFPIVMFRNIKKWFCLDSQPNSEFGDLIAPGLDRPRFIELLKQNMQQTDFELQLIDGDNYTFYNKEHDQLVIYETNSVFPRDVQNRHYDCDYLVLCGFDLEDETINFINKFPHIITNNRRCFQSDEEQLLLSQDVYTIIIDTEWEYWEPKNQLTHLIEQYVRVEHQFAI